MANVLDEVILQLVPEIDKAKSQKANKKLEKDLEKSIEKSTEKGLKKGAQKGSGFLKNIFGGGGTGFLKGTAIAGVVAAIASKIISKVSKVALEQSTKALSEVEQQIDIADKLATVAAQTGINLKDFLKLQKLLEFGDVDAAAAQEAIVEFQKRLGDFQKTGAQKEFFAGLGITQETGGAEAFLRAISAAQNASGAERQALADKLFGGLGTRQLAEFLSGNLSEQLNSIKNIDFATLAENVARGSSEQTKITTAKVQSSIDKLLQINLQADTTVNKIQNETARAIANTAVNYDAVSRAAETNKNALNSLANATTRVVGIFANLENAVVDFTGSLVDKITD